jgi:hypothetical protein
MNKLEYQCGMHIGNEGNFAQNLSTLAEKGMEPLSLRDYAKAIYESPPERLWASPQAFVKEGCVYIPKKATLLVRNSPLVNQKTAEDFSGDLRESWEASQAEQDRYAEEGNFDRRQEAEDKWNLKPISIQNGENYLGMAEEDREKEPEERRVLDVTEYFGDNQYIMVPVSKVSNHEIFRWAFRDYLDRHMEQYMPKDSRDRMVVLGGNEVRDIGNNPHARQIWFSPSENEILAGTNEKHLLLGRIFGNKIGENE